MSLDDERRLWERLVSSRPTTEQLVAIVWPQRGGKVTTIRLQDELRATRRTLRVAWVIASVEGVVLVAVCGLQLLGVL